ncbi:hypothetical protein [Stutzerimonas kunmingensis]|nr:hypothetical protein [Stutzerimonas kunmingensis]
MRPLWLGVSVALVLVLVLGLLMLAWWGWQRGGLALLQMGLGTC